MFPDPEAPDFDPNGPYSAQGARFQHYVLDVLERGLPENEDPREPGMNQYAIGDLRNNDNTPFGLGHLFDDVNIPRVFIFTPSDRDPMDLSPMYPEHVAMMMGRLGRIFGNDQLFADPKLGQVITYQPLLYPADPGDLPGDMNDPGFNTHRGKILIQYMPAPRACTPNAELAAQWRMFTEGEHDSK